MKQSNSQESLKVRLKYTHGMPIWQLKLKQTLIFNLMLKPVQYPDPMSEYERMIILMFTQIAINNQ